jgi:cellulose synthase/poly-beta-1,6-N-acetylglucosamine synthase-like glycosyltransferase
MRPVVESVLQAWNIFMLGYFVVLQLTYTLLAAIGWRTVEDYVRRRPTRDYRLVAESEMSMPVSILVPGYNEELSIVASVRSLLTSQFTEFEVVVINDGSKDATMAALIEAFHLVPVDRVPHSNIATKPILGVYASPLDPRIVVIDKANGGKADALNAGINHAVYPLFCAIDADTMLDPGALSRLVWEFQAAPETVAVGGIVRIVNGSLLKDGRLLNVRTPRNLLANLQILEYLRAFLGGRVGWSQRHAADHLGRVRPVPARPLRGGRRLRPDDGRGGRRARPAAAPPSARKGRGVPDHLLPGPDLLDRVPGGPAHARPPA